MDAELIFACGQAHPVKYADAGSQITCACQQVIEVPKLSLLRKMVTEVLKQNPARKPSQPPSLPLENRPLLAWICVLYGIYLLIGIMITFHATSDMTLSTDNESQRFVRLRVIVSFIVFVILSILACAGQTWAKVFLIIKRVLAIPVLIALMCIDHEMIYAVDIFMSIAFIIALIRIRT